MDYLLNELLKYLLQQPDYFANHSDVEKKLDITPKQLLEVLINSQGLFDYNLEAIDSVKNVSLSTKGISRAKQIMEQNKNQKKSDFKNNFSYPLAAQLTVNVLVFLTGLLIGYLTK